MNRIFTILFIYLSFSSCKERTDISGEIKWDKDQNKLELTLRNDGLSDYYFSYYALKGEKLNEKKEIDFMQPLHITLDTLIESRDHFSLKVKAEHNYQKAHKGTHLDGSEPIYPAIIPYLEYLNSYYFFIEKDTQIKLIYDIVEPKYGDYIISFTSLEFVNFRKDIKEKFYSNGKISGYSPYTGFIDIKPITITFQNTFTD